MQNRKKTKILAKIADNRAEPAFLKALFDAGADVAWLNTAHQGEAETIEVMNKIRAITVEIPIMIDTKGPEIRTCDISEPIVVKVGDSLIFTGDKSYVGANVVHVTYANFHNEVPVGSSVLYDDANIETVVEEKLENGIRAVVKNGGVIKNKKSLNIPNVHIMLPALSEKDTSFIHFCAKHNVDFIIHSFVRTKEDIFDIKKITAQYPEYKGKIIAKIENREGFDHVEEILENCDGLMVARGDLGAEVPLEELPYMQKKMVDAALRHGKYAIVATQVLESMIKNPRPTRAEVTDIANAVLDGTDAVSMSGETAYGDYPLEATMLMGRVMAYTESKKSELIHCPTNPASTSARTKAAHAIALKAQDAGVKAILLPIEDASLAREISTFRPSMPIVVSCVRGEDQRELRLAYGIYGVKVEKAGLSEITTLASQFVGAQDTVLVVEGSGDVYTSALKKFEELYAGSPLGAVKIATN